MRNIFFLLLFPAIGCANQNYDTEIRGELQWKELPRKIIDCDSKETYELQLKDYEQYEYIEKKLNELRLQGDKKIILKLVGEAKQILNTIGTVVLGSWVEVSKFIEIKEGSCEDSSA